MIQRIQTLLFLGALVLMILLLSFPLIYLPNNITIYCLEQTPLMMLSLVSTAGVITTILLFKARMVQIRLSIFNTVVLLGLQGWIVYYCFFALLPGASFSFTAVFPVAAAILTVLAIRYVGRDEAIVRTMNRLRK